MRNFGWLAGWLGGLVLAAAVTAPASASTSPWTIQPTPRLQGQPSYLSEVSCYSADTCLAVGTEDPDLSDERGLVEWWQNGTWKRHNNYLSLTPMAGVSCTSTPQLHGGWRGGGRG
jgi:hypothetical protein